MGAGVAALGGAVYVAGGMSRTGGQLLTSVEKFDPKTDTAWNTSVPDLVPLDGPTPGRYLHVLVAMAGQLWSIGGSTRQSALSNVCYFSGGKNGQWHGAEAGVPQLPCLLYTSPSPRDRG